MRTPSTASKEWLLDVTKALLRRCGAQVLDAPTHDPRQFELGAGGLEAALRQVFLRIDGDMHGTVREASPPPLSGSILSGCARTRCRSRGAARRPHGADVVLAVMAWWRSESGLRVGTRTRSDDCAGDRGHVGFWACAVAARRRCARPCARQTFVTCWRCARSLARTAGCHVATAPPVASRSETDSSRRCASCCGPAVVWPGAWASPGRTVSGRLRLQIGPHGLRHAPDEEDTP